MAGATGPAVVGGPPGPKRPGLLAWAKKHKTAAAAGLGGVGLAALYLIQKGRANAASDTTDSSGQMSATTQGTGQPASFDGGGSDDSAAFQQLSDQLTGIGTQLSNIGQNQNPSPSPSGTNFYQLAKSVLEKNGNKNPSKREIDRERRRLLQVLGGATKGKLITEKIPNPPRVHKPVKTRK